ncbi:GIY-YIG nuclease family protein [Pararhodospirillum photometricum]|nr:GIY-YIG nuclease family protein [Pararhodospirillum photometricum]
MPDPFTIRIFVPDGDPEGVRLIDRMNWTGLGVVFPRAKWSDVRQRAEMLRTGVYILVGYTEQDDDLPTVYVGQTDDLRSRIDSHCAKKDFWDWGVVFVSNNSGGLNRAHVTWLEYALVKRATEAARCHLDNNNAPQEPGLSEAEKADTRAFLKEIVQILPLVGLRVFETPKAVAVPRAADPSIVTPPRTKRPDTIIVPAQREGFVQVFLGQNCWHAIRIAGGMLDKIKYVAGYQTHPTSAITHYAPVAAIEPYGEEGKYKLIFSEKAKAIGPIPYGDAPPGAMQGPRYTTFEKLRGATTLKDLLVRDCPEHH